MKGIGFIGQLASLLGFASVAPVPVPGASRLAPPVPRIKAPTYQRHFGGKHAGGSAAPVCPTCGVTLSQGSCINRMCANRDVKRFHAPITRKLVKPCSLKGQERAQRAAEKARAAA